MSECPEKCFCADCQMERYWKAIAKADAAKLSLAAEEVHHPSHYTAHPSGIECITITEHMGFNLGNAMKYIWRADLKGDATKDLNKAVWYIQRELERRKNSQCPPSEEAS